MVDHSIVMIVPSADVCANAEKVIQRNNWHYEVFCADCDEAPGIVNQLIPKGLKIAIAYGLMAESIIKENGLPTLELSFSAPETVMPLLEFIDKGQKVAHVGTRRHYNAMVNSLKFFKRDPDMLTFFERKIGDRPEDVLKGKSLDGFAAVTGFMLVPESCLPPTAKKVFFKVDETIIEDCFRDAQILLKTMENFTKADTINKLVNETSFESIITLDERRIITNITHPATEVLKCKAEDALGMSFDELLKKANCVDVENVINLDSKLYNGVTPVVLHEKPIIIDDKLCGYIAQLRTANDVRNVEYSLTKDALLQGFSAKYRLSDVLGSSPAIQSAKEQALKYAKYDSSILLLGETGTGKELFAQGIHNASSRERQPFVPINCAAIPANLIESELFGYAKGAFTGANREGKAGLFELANGGTLFLDEVSEIPLEMQSKLLRAIQEGEVVRIGGDKVIHVNVRIICASNKDLLKLVNEGKFKQDLYYRLCVLEIRIPALRERSGDLGPLAYSFMSSFKRKYDTKAQNIDPEVLKAMSALPFSGNIRELRNLVERMVILCESETIDMDTLRKCCPDMNTERPPESSSPVSKSLNLKDNEFSKIMEALEQSNNSKVEAARRLGISTTTLWRRLKEYGII